ncbi:S41 family peptidase [Pedobacter gandavensis]|uniref:S41 family peptidase n=1 Tax=Pedobacter gandavensis TaxID=2679963 RepID=UPI0039774946
MKSFPKEIRLPDILRPETRDTYNATYSITGKVVFLTDESAISASESLLGLVKDFNLGTLIGSLTAGANGEVNIALMPYNR